ncbi:HypC/HybG/HupF family hydrogenase formation chaperone [Candidatus Woesearchaeota archaeon]|nr:HypC/HybG/HupF family hydrogenase formation chaperone [Candidatus Woesearchaeota archaeon]
MCLAYPGKIVKIDGDMATIDYDTEKRSAKMIDKFNVGDYVIVQGKIVIQKVPKKDAEEFIKMVKHEG